MKILIEAECPPAEKLIGKNDPAVERRWKELEARAQAVLKQKNKIHSITWSSNIDWGGFAKKLSYAKTLNDEIIHREEAADPDTGAKMVKLTISKDKKSFMTQIAFNKLLPTLEPFLKMAPNSFTRSRWNY